jgi:hypothetical protein
MDAVHSQVVLQIRHWKDIHQKRGYLAYETYGDSLLFRDPRFGDTRDVLLIAVANEV